MLVLSEILKSTRLRQWPKNLIVYFAFFFTINQRLGANQATENIGLFINATSAFLLLCMLSGAAYIINDLVDADHDSHHPLKRRRPIASGRLSFPTATAAAATLASCSIVGAFTLNPWFGVVATGYFGLTITYSLVLKNIALVDVMALSIGYVLRAIAGAVLIGVPISPWLYIITSLGSLLIGVGKRRTELALVVEANPDLEWRTQQRGVLRDYSVHLLDQFIAVLAPSTLIAYILYTFTAMNLPTNHAMMLTIPFVLYGLLRYLYLIYNSNLGETPEEVLLIDKPLIVTVAMWLATAVLVLIMFD